MRTIIRTGAPPARPPLSQLASRSLVVSISHGLNDEYLSGYFLKMLRGGFAPSGYRQSIKRPTNRIRSPARPS